MIQRTRRWHSTHSHCCWQPRDARLDPVDFVIELLCCPFGLVANLVEEPGEDARVHMRAVGTVLDILHILAHGWVGTAVAEKATRDAIQEAKVKGTHQATGGAGLDLKLHVDRILWQTRFT